MCPEIKNAEFRRFKNFENLENVDNFENVDLKRIEAKFYIARPKAVWIHVAYQIQAITS